MKYGRTANGEKWHMLRKDKALCLGVAKTTSFVATMDQKPPDEDVCENCDGRLRLKGEKARKEQMRQMRQRPQSKELYDPRFKFQE